MKHGLVKLLALTMSIAIILSFAACSGGGDSETTTEETTILTGLVDIASVYQDSVNVIETIELKDASGKTVALSPDTALTVVKDAAGVVTGLATADGTVIYVTEVDGLLAVDIGADGLVTFGAAEVPTTLPGDETTAPVPVEGSTAVEDTTAPVETTLPTLTAPVGGTVADILSFYNTAANATKASKDFTVSKTEGTTTTLKKTDLKMFKEKIEGLAQDMLPNDIPLNSYKETFVNGKGTENADRTPAKFLPPEDQAYMSKLTEAGVKSATCTADGTGWKIVIKLVSETETDIDATPKHHSSCMETLDLTSDDLDPFTLNSAEFQYTGATITAVVNAQGKLDKLDIVEPMYIEGYLGYSVGPIKLASIYAEVEGKWEQHITFTW